MLASAWGSLPSARSILFEHYFRTVFKRELNKPIDTGGRWCVQIGAFHSEHDAIKLKQELLREYTAANVIEFPGEKSYWVRIRPEGDNRQMAEYIARHLQPTEGEAFLTRLD